jgi:hypothetical protein
LQLITNEAVTTSATSTGSKGEIVGITNNSISYQTAVKELLHYLFFCLPCSLTNSEQRACRACL